MRTAPQFLRSRCRSTRRGRSRRRAHAPALGPRPERGRCRSHRASPAGGARPRRSRRTRGRPTRASTRRPLRRRMTARRRTRPPHARRRRPRTPLRARRSAIRRRRCAARAAPSRPAAPLPSARSVKRSRAADPKSLRLVHGFLRVHHGSRTTASEDWSTASIEGAIMRQAVLAVVVLSAAVLASGTSAGATSGSGRNGRVLYSETYQYAYGSGFLYAINPNGSGRVLITGNAVNGSWSPDGRRILFETARKGDLDLWTINA